MSKTMSFKVGATLTAPVGAIVPVEPTRLTDCAKCEGNINLGLFFDGTNNNMERDAKDFADSNVARLSHTYLENNEKGYYRRYIPGVGTPFPEIGEAGESSLGSGFAIGCEQRVLYALLWVFNAIHRSAFNEQVFSMMRKLRHCAAASRATHQLCESMIKRHWQAWGLKMGCGFLTRSVTACESPS